MKYSLVGGLNLLLGLTGLVFIVFLSQATVIVQSLLQGGTSFNLDFLGSTLPFIFIFLIGLVNLFAALKLFTGNKESYFSLGIFSLMSACLALAPLLGTILPVRS